MMSSLRSSQWCHGDDRGAYIDRAWIRRGRPGNFWQRPQIAIANVASTGGPLALVRTGDWISLDVRDRRLDLEIQADELVAREPDEATVRGFANPRRGWERLHVDSVQQADRGAHLDFLVESSGSTVSRESH